MPSSGTFTVTGTAGPGQAVTAQVFTGVTSFAVDIVNSILSLTLPNGEIKNINIGAETTFTATLSGAGGNWTVVVD